MDKSKRTFLKIAGLGSAGVYLGVKGAQLHANKTPEADKRYAMVIDTKLLTADVMSAAMAACHREHNVPHISNPNCDQAPPDKQAVKWIWETDFDSAFPEQVHHMPKVARRSVLVLCNHCDEPPCVRVCPTKATWKRESDGIVTIDMHRCIGCRYCIAACPYGSRSFNFKDPRRYLEFVQATFPTRTHGVVEKCNFCVERVGEGKKPACVEACEQLGSKALRFGALTAEDLSEETSEIGKVLRNNFSLRRKPSLGTGPEVYYIL
jgi:molybdopterin-containing oxidoreductase family iron-sulfur binding subunit